MKKICAVLLLIILLSFSACGTADLQNIEKDLNDIKEVGKKAVMFIMNHRSPDSIPIGSEKEIEDYKEMVAAGYDPMQPPYIETEEEETEPAEPYDFMMGIEYEEPNPEFVQAILDNADYVSRGITGILMALPQDIHYGDTVAAMKPVVHYILDKDGNYVKRYPDIVSTEAESQVFPIVSNGILICELGVYYDDSGVIMFNFGWNAQIEYRNEVYHDNLNRRFCWETNGKWYKYYYLLPAEGTAWTHSPEDAIACLFTYTEYEGEE